MQIDRKLLKKILTLNDRQLSELVVQIANEAGIDPNELGINAENMRTLRETLANATDADMEKLNDVYRNYRNNRSAEGKG